MAHKQLGPRTVETGCSRSYSVRTWRRLSIIPFSTEGRRACPPQAFGSSSSSSGLKQESEPRAPQAARTQQAACELSRRSLLSMCLAAVVLRPAVAVAADGDDAPAGGGAGGSSVDACALRDTDSGFTCKRASPPMNLAPDPPLPSPSPAPPPRPPLPPSKGHPTPACTQRPAACTTAGALHAPEGAPG